MRRYNKGWRLESARHGLAAQGVKTGSGSDKWVIEDSFGRKLKEFEPKRFDAETHLKEWWEKADSVDRESFFMEMPEEYFVGMVDEKSYLDASWDDIPKDIRDGMVKHFGGKFYDKIIVGKDRRYYRDGKLVRREGLGAKGKSYTYRIVDIENPKGLTLNQTEMVRYAKKMLSASKRQGYDKEVMSSDISEPVNAWVYLKNIGLGESTDRTVWAKGKRPVFIKEPFGLPRELQPTGMYRKKWKSVHDARVKEIQQDFKRMYGRKPTSHEMQDIILLEGEW